MSSIKLRLKNSVRWELWTLMVGALATRVFGLGTPNATVFDEIYFKQFPAYYFTHQYYFDQHPPLGKLLLAGWMWLFHINPATLPTHTSATFRLFVALFGVAIVPLVYGILYRLTKSRLIAGLGGLMVALNGVFIVESRFVLMDSMLVCFGLAAVYAALRWYELYVSPPHQKKSSGIRRQTRGTPLRLQCFTNYVKHTLDTSNRRPLRYQKVFWLLATGLLTGAAASIKWTGLTAGVLVLVILVAAWVKHRPRTREIVGKSILLFVVTLFVYLGSFWIHFQLLTKSGPGDAFMAPAFQATLVGNPLYSSSARRSFLDKTIELNVEMYLVNANLRTGHPYSSKWYTWPYEKRPVYFWDGPVLAGGRQGNIYLLGNPIIWWASSVSVVVAAGLLFVPWFRRPNKRLTRVICFLLIAFLINWLPFAKIGRVMFLYHYLFASIFSTMLLAILVGGVVRTGRHWQRSLRLLMVVALVGVTIVGFLYYAPLNYGWSLSPSQLQERMILSSWR